MIANLMLRLQDRENDGRTVCDVVLCLLKPPLELDHTTGRDLFIPSYDLLDVRC